MVKTIEERYKKLTQREHVLLRPQMYIGSIHNELRRTFVVEDINSDEIKIIQKLVNMNPGFLKIFDEIFSNATDHYIRTNGKVKYIKVDVFEDYIIIENDGGIPIEMHKEHNVYVPEMLFSHFLSGENFDQNDKRGGVGQNGLGAVLTSTWSKKFIVETADGKKEYYQEFRNNLEIIDKPKIKSSNKNYTKITFYPDLKRFGIEKITPEIEQLLLKRICAGSAYCPKVNIFYNNKQINIKSFKDYIKLHIEKDIELFYERINDDWEIGVVQSPDDSFNQSSLINSSPTIEGGTHVDLVLNQLVNGIKEFIEKKHKKIEVKPNDIKNKLWLFLNSKVINPEFDSQTKEKLKSKLTEENIGIVKISEDFIKKISQSSIVQDIIDFINLKEKAELAKLTKGKVSKVKIRKLDDANRAGTSESERCNLILTEGDSALTTCITGFSETGRDYFGAFPMRGKLLNVRDFDLRKIKDEKSSTGEEIRSIVNALGLEFGKKYTSTKELRYGKLTIFTDADCLDENTLIIVKRGIIPIKDITYDDEVLTHTGKYQSVKNIIKSIKKEYVKILVNGKYINFGLYHKQYVVRDGEVCEVFAKDILKTDFLLCKKKI